MSLRNFPQNFPLSSLTKNLLPIQSHEASPLALPPKRPSTKSGAFARTRRQQENLSGKQSSAPRWQPHVLTRLLRRRSVYWALAIGLIILTVVVTYSQNSRASSIISNFGEQQDVLVVTRYLERGEAITPADFRIEQRPVGFVPPGALSNPADLNRPADLGVTAGSGAGQVTLEPIYAGEILMSGRVGTSDDLHIPPGTNAIALPVGESRPSLNRGDRVDLLGSFPDGPAGEVSVLLVAQSAFVVETADRFVTVAVQPSELSGVVRALTHGVVTIVLRG